jgi:hypothetical protein
VAVWLRAGIDAAAPVEGLGGPNGAYQLPGATTPQLPGLLPSRDPFHVAAAITPNGWNELLDALTRAGFLESQAFTLTELDLFGNGSTTPINAGLLQFLVTGFARYPAVEPIAVRVSPSGVAPVVSGRRGPGGEAIDVQLAQVGIEFVDASGVVALGLRADARVGVDVGLATSGAGTLGATARRLELLGFTIVENRIGADLQQVATNLLCVDADPSAALSCAIASLLSDGLDHVLASAALPSLEDGTDGFALTPKCLVRLDDGSLVAEFLLRLPGDPAPPRLPGVASIGACVAPPIADGGGSSGGAVGPVQGEVLTEGFLLRN